MKKGIAALLIAFGLSGGCGPKGPTWKDESTSKECANYLGVHYTIEDGATEALDAFGACITNEEYRAELAYKYEGR